MQATRAIFHCSQLRRLLLGLTLLIALTLGLAPATPAYAATCAGTAITGTAFRDYNASGTQDVREPGIAGIVVTAYDAGGGSASCETTADGSYGIDSVNGFPVRIEFTRPTDGSLHFLQPGPVGTGSRDCDFCRKPRDPSECRF